MYWYLINGSYTKKYKLPFSLEQTTWKIRFFDPMSSLDKDFISNSSPNTINFYYSNNKIKSISFFDKIEIFYNFFFFSG